MKLIITEKPSVARDIARVLGAKRKGEGFLSGDDVTLTWCLGHLLELEEPAAYSTDWKRWRMDVLPMVPETFGLKLRKGMRERWGVVRRLLRDRGFDTVVNACDAGREGELIFRRAYLHAGSTLPIERLWLSSMTDSAIRDAWSRLKQGSEFDDLAEAARCRSEADWIVGLNATRAMTLRVREGGGDQIMSVGRVQTPTLAMIVTRDRAIESFVSETYWLVKSGVRAEAGGWEALLIGPSQDRKKDSSFRFKVREDVEQMVSLLEGATGVVSVNERQKKSTPPPLLYDLTSLQQRANQRYGFTAEQTLTLAQALYETHKVLTYPRTDARYLTGDQVAELPDVVRGLQPIPTYAPFCETLLAGEIQPGSRVVNEAEVGDHHAIIPTGRTPNSGRLSPDEKRLFDLVARRFLAALYPSAQHERARLVVDVTDLDEAALPGVISQPVQLEAKGRVTLDPGWMVVDPPKSESDKTLPDVDVGCEVVLSDTKSVEKQTQPPKRYTDGTLLKAMETAGKQLDEAELKRAMRRSGLGTPATRAAILRTLLDRGFVQRKKRELWSTEKGRVLLDAVPEDAVKSPQLTGQYEASLTRISEGKERSEVFMETVVSHARQLIAQIQSNEAPSAELFKSAPTPELGGCPVCSQPVREQRAVFACDAGRSCAFVVFKTMAKRKISARMVKALLKEGRSPIVKGFKSKKGNLFDAGLVWQNDKVGFYFPPRAGGARVGDACPSCSTGRVIRGKSALGCSEWRAGCDWRQT